MKKSILLATFFCICINIGFAQRYLSPIFTSSNITTDIEYGESVNYLGNNEILLLDFYEPTGDTLEERPLLVYCHGGGFTDTNQSKSLTHIVAYCDSMARRGYAVASIDYRLDISISNRAVINAMHDAKAAIRFFRANANSYKIDPDLVFIAGESAGAVTALNCTYVDQETEVLFPPVAPMSTDNSVEGNSGSAGFSSSTKAALCFCGGTTTVLNELLFDTLAMEASTDPPLLQVHGTADPLIPVAKALEVSIRANNINLPFLFYAMEDATHCPWFYPLPDSWAYLDTLIDYTVPFLYACVTGNPTSTDEKFQETVINVFPNPTQDLLYVKSDFFQNQSVTISLNDISGRAVYKNEKLAFAKTLSIDLEHLNPGVYFLTVSYQDQHFTKTIRIE